MFHRGGAETGKREVEKGYIERTSTFFFFCWEKGKGDVGLRPKKLGQLKESNFPLNLGGGRRLIRSKKRSQADWGSVKAAGTQLSYLPREVRENRVFNLKTGKS